ncbi:unnamed protein product [Diplocarpon coronariae]
MAKSTGIAQRKEEEGREGEGCYVEVFHSDPRHDGMHGPRAQAEIRKCALDGVEMLLRSRDAHAMPSSPMGSQAACLDGLSSSDLPEKLLLSPEPQTWQMGGRGLRVQDSQQRAPTERLDGICQVKCGLETGDPGRQFRPWRFVGGAPGDQASPGEASLQPDHVDAGATERESWVEGRARDHEITCKGGPSGSRVEDGMGDQIKADLGWLQREGREEGSGRTIAGIQRRNPLTVYTVHAQHSRVVSSRVRSVAEEAKNDSCGLGIGSGEVEDWLGFFDLVYIPAWALRMARITWREDVETPLPSGGRTPLARQGTFDARSDRDGLADGMKWRWADRQMG